MVESGAEEVFALENPFVLFGWPLGVVFFLNLLEKAENPIKSQGKFSFPYFNSSTIGQYLSLPLVFYLQVLNNSEVIDGVYPPPKFLMVFFNQRESNFHYHVQTPPESLIAGLYEMCFVLFVLFYYNYEQHVFRFLCWWLCL